MMRDALGGSLPGGSKSFCLLFNDSRKEEVGSSG